MIRVRYQVDGCEPTVLEVAEKPELTEAAEFLNAIRARLFPGVELPPFVPEKPEEAPKPTARRRLDEKPIEFVDEDEVASAAALEQPDLF